MHVATVVALCLLSACGDNGGNGTPAANAQPTPQVTAFRPGAFDELPRYPRAAPVGRATEKHGVVAQSFSTTGTTPARVVRWYATALERRGWVIVEQPHAAGTTDWRLTVANDRDRLEVSSAPAPTLSDRGRPVSADEVEVQYSLTLQPR